MKLFILTQNHMSYDKDMDVLGIFESEDLVKMAVLTLFKREGSLDTVKSIMEEDQGIRITECELNKAGYII